MSASNASALIKWMSKLAVCKVYIEHPMSLLTTPPRLRVLKPLRRIILPASKKQSHLSTLSSSSCSNSLSIQQKYHASKSCYPKRDQVNPSRLFSVMDYRMISTYKPLLIGLKASWKQSTAPRITCAQLISLKKILKSGEITSLSRQQMDKRTRHQ